MKRKESLNFPAWLLAIFACILMFAGTALAAGPTEKVLYRFKGGSDGAEPYSSLVFDAAGNLYGTTQFGGGGCRYECGTVFQLTLDSEGRWNETVLHRFTGPDGKYPHGGLVLDKSGNLYGTTSNGGRYDGGIVFKLTPHADGTWKESILHHFGYGKDGAYPFAGLIWDAAGNLYGTAQGGGGHVCKSSCGTVFKLTPAAGGHWQETTLYAFKGGKDGSWVQGGVVFDTAGNLYGVTTFYPGTVFRLTPTSNGYWKKTLLHAFEGGQDGVDPVGTLVIDAAGDLYGATNADGACQFCGSVFRLTPTTHGPWNKSTLHEFKNGKDGRQPYDGVVFDAAGNLYGATHDSGDPTCDCGTVFKLAPRTSSEWRETILHTFKGSGDGAGPHGGLILDTAGNVYGVTAGDGWGVVYMITP
jgi:uncharacterized repeat protein (TIGR03803 family)